jgi:plastocyanin domain-containing protein
MTLWLVNAGGVVLMGLIVWWFWLWQPRQTARAAGGTLDITVANGVYEPDFIEMKRGETLTLRFHRNDPSPCAEQVIFHGLDVSEQLPVGGVKTVRITPQQSGIYRFTCQMQMYQGKLKVVD